MDMKVDSQKLIQLRNARAWSQQHLADVSGLSLRTIQRIEKTQSASHD
ncbi:helix-turn-helix transcriptional regulator [Alteromonas sp. MmMcT2-5]|nr:helix-turn-helix transcriptional regulator [Alteromonas sp. MmMcT2-5]MCG7649738.1 helix-turn-helix domain-containing protein [Alteromonas sp. MmMcT2-5]